MPSPKLAAMVVLTAAIVLAAVGVAATFLNAPPRVANDGAAASPTPGEILASSASLAPDASASASGLSAATDFCGLDVSWLRASVPFAKYEIAGAALALDRGSEPAVRALAQRLTDDHVRSATSLEALAAKLGIDVQATPTASQEWILDELKEMSPSSFAHDYPELEANDHAQLVADAQLEVQMGCNAEVKALAAAQVPVLDELARLAQAAVPAGSGE